jgi:hypothetical protein
MQMEVGPVHAMKPYMGRECISPYILNEAALLTGNEPTVPIELGDWVGF